MAEMNTIDKTHQNLVHDLIDLRKKMVECYYMTPDGELKTEMIKCYSYLKKISNGVDRIVLRNVKKTRLMNDFE